MQLETVQLIISGMIVLTTMILLRAVLELSARTGYLEGRIAWIESPIGALPAREGARPSKVSAAEWKKEAILKTGPKTFYYLDESQVKDLYPQVVQELEPTRIEKRESKEARGGIAAKLFNLVQPKYERARSEETTEIYEVERTAPIMYNKIEWYFLEGDKITFGLEEFEVDDSSIDEFLSTCDKMREKFNFEIPDDLQEHYISDKYTDAAFEQLDKFSHISDYVAIQAKFSVSGISDEVYILTFVHPISVHLPPSDEVRIQLTCVKDYMTPSGISTLKQDRSVKITCLGKVVSWSDENKVLEISPLAIY